MPATSYELIDFGAGRKLERFGRHLLDRPSPAGDRAERRQPLRWRAVVAHYDRGSEQSGEWLTKGLAEPWTIALGPLAIELKLTPQGQVGLFPEQAENWRWIDGQVRAAGRPKVLNLFGYTGASTLVAAAAGAEVVHVDAAAGIVAWARRNAELSGLTEAPIRWIVEDAVRFVQRELKRGNAYDAVILDPPAYGHGPKGQAWKLESDLPELLMNCLALCRGRERFVLLSCHSGELATAAGLREFVQASRFDAGTPLRAEYHDMRLVSTTGQILPSGAAVRWSVR